MLEACSLIELAVLDLHRSLEDAVLTLCIQQLDLALRGQKQGILERTLVEYLCSHMRLHAQQHAKSSDAGVQATHSPANNMVGALDVSTRGLL